MKLSDLDLTHRNDAINQMVSGAVHDMPDFLDQRLSEQRQRAIKWALQGKLHEMLVRFMREDEQRAAISERLSGRLAPTIEIDDIGLPACRED